MRPKGSSANVLQDMRKIITCYLLQEVHETGYGRPANTNSLNVHLVRFRYTLSHPRTGYKREFYRYVKIWSTCPQSAVDIVHKLWPTSAHDVRLVKLSARS